MGRRAASTSASRAASAPHTLQEHASRVLDAAPSKEVLDVVAALYAAHLTGDDEHAILMSVRALDALGFLEKGLWPLVRVAASAHDCRHHVKKAWVTSVMLAVNYKARDGDNEPWRFLEADVPQEGEESAFASFLTTLLTLMADAEAESEDDDAAWSLTEKSVLTQFLIVCFQSLEVSAVASSVLKLTSLPLWGTLSASQRALEFQSHPKLARHYQRVMADEATEQPAKPAKRRKLKTQTQGTTRALTHEQSFLVHRLDEFVAVLRASVDDVDASEVAHRLRFAGLFLVLLTDLLSQLPTRRFLLTVLRRRHLRSVLKRSVLVRHCLEWRRADERDALKRQLTLLDACMRFPVDAHTGESLSVREHRERHGRRLQSLQQVAFRPAFRNTQVETLAVAPCAHLADAESFSELLQTIVRTDRSRLVALGVAVGVLADQNEGDTLSDVELVDAFVEEYSIDSSEDTQAIDTPVFPTELDIWSDLLDAKRPSDAVDGDKPMEEAQESVYGADDHRLFPLLPVRKLGLQFLNLADYLQRNYELLRLEAAEDIRGDLQMAVKQLDAVRALRSASANETIFRGFARSAVPLSSALQIVKVAKPALGKRTPATVLAQLEVELSGRHDAKRFDCYQTKEVVYLVTLRATADEGAELMGFQKRPVQGDTSFPEAYGVQYVRAGEIVEVADAVGKQINEENPVGRGRKRVFKLALDGVQYKRDLEAGRLDAYEQVNVLVRRNPRENNFKAVLDTVASAWRDASKEDLLPTWLHDLFLGYGDPAAALYTSIYSRKGDKKVVVPLGDDLLLDGQHALEAGGVSELVDVADPAKKLSAEDAEGPFTYVEDVRDGKAVIQAHRKGKKSSQTDVASVRKLRFTKAQVAAVRTGLCDGLTVVVGPPGTGKTDVAVQLVLNLYRTTPAREKILLVAHSNQALNDFFSKLLALEAINEAEIVRMGPPQLATDGEKRESDAGGAFHADFSRNGRVAFLLARRLALLQEVEVMAQWLAEKDATQYAGLAGGSAAYSCENALFFYQFYMKRFLDAVREASELPSDSSSEVAALVEFFTTRKGAKPESVEALRQFAVDIESYFAELRRLQPFELLQTARQRGDMYLIHHARIVAMTCTHAALNHSKLSALGLEFGSLVMEEAGQVSELDNFVPLLLAGASTKSGQKMPTLKRVVLLGDPKQLPPVVKSPALKTYARLDQSLFSRLLRLGVPHVVLDQQGRSRTALADVFRWRYTSYDSVSGRKTLKDLPRVTSAVEFQSGNTGLAHVVQFVDLKSSAERQPRPFAFENEAEARFLVALFRYLLRVGHRAEQITMLTPYAAQKELLQRLLQSEPTSCNVLTVDRFQGQQSDLVLLSTVRSEGVVGHLRDVRRATTAFSRARLGLYVVGCGATLRQAPELQPFLTALEAVAKNDAEPTRLALLPPQTKTSKTKQSTVHVSSYEELEQVLVGLSD